MLKHLLTNWVDVKEAYGCAEYGAEHAVVQGLRTFHQHVEQDKIPSKAKNDGGYSQTCENNQQDILLYVIEITYRGHADAG